MEPPSPFPISLDGGVVRLAGGVSWQLDELGVRHAAGIAELLDRVHAEPGTAVHVREVGGRPDTVGRHLASFAHLLDALRARVTDPAQRAALDRYRVFRRRGRGGDGWCRYDLQVVEHDGESVVHPASGMRLRLVPGGTFRRGREDAWHTDERPEHGARLSPYFIAEIPVTNAHYRRFLDQLRAAHAAGSPGWRAWIDRLGAVWAEMSAHIRDADLVPGLRRLRWPRPGEEADPAFVAELLGWLEPGQWDQDRQSTMGSGRTVPGGYDPQAVRAPEHPVVGVDWLCMQGWCLWYGLELPTEAMWEFAAQGAVPPARTVARPTSGLPPDTLPPSDVGARGMLGNCWEWTRDYYAPYPAEQAEPAWDPTQRAPLGAGFRVVRGGSFEPTSVPIGPSYRGANQMLWRAPWDTFRPSASFRFETIAALHGLDPTLTERCGARLTGLLALLDPPPGEAEADRAHPYLGAAARRRRHRFLVEIRRVVRSSGGEEQVSLIGFDGRPILHAVTAARLGDVPGLRALAETALCGAQSRPYGGFGWIDDLDVRGRRHPGLTRITWCAWSRVPGAEEILLVERHARIDDGADVAGVVRWLRRLGWPDRRRPASADPSA